jgi:hypothetical protein
VRRCLEFFLVCSLSLAFSNAFGQLPTFPAATRLLQIPVLEAQIGEARSYFSIALQASEDYSAFTLVDAAELDLLTYDRDSWKHWEDFDGDCQNTRQELLITSSEVPVTFTSSSGCTVSAGQWLGLYTGNAYTLASDLDIDHIISLKYAHDSGGAVWSAFVKKLFANDPENLLAVDDGENQSKSAKGPSEWMPPDAAYHCEYVRRWSFLAKKYELSLDAEDSALVKSVMQGCTY